jgi:hypothetical protein
MKRPRKQKQVMSEVMDMQLSVQSGRKFRKLSATKKDAYEKCKTTVNETKQAKNMTLSTPTFNRYLRTLRIYRSLELGFCPRCEILRDLKKKKELTQEEKVTLERKNYHLYMAKEQQSYLKKLRQEQKANTKFNRQEIT